MAGLPNSSNALQQWHHLFEADGAKRSPQAQQHLQQKQPQFCCCLNSFILRTKTTQTPLLIDRNCALSLYNAALIDECKSMLNICGQPPECALNLTPLKMSHLSLAMCAKC